MEKKRPTWLLVGISWSTSSTLREHQWPLLDVLFSWKGMTGFPWGQILVVLVMSRMPKPVYFKDSDMEWHKKMSSRSVLQPLLRATATAAASWARAEAAARALGMHSLQLAKGHPLQARNWKYHCAGTVLIHSAECSSSFLHGGFLLCVWRWNADVPGEGTGTREIVLVHGWFPS